MNADADVPPPNPPSFDAIAQRAREAMKQMIEALANEMKDEEEATGRPIDWSLWLRAIATGNMCQATEFFFNTMELGQVPHPEGLKEIHEQVDAYWKQALVMKLTNAARETRQQRRRRARG